MLFPTLFTLFATGLLPSAICLSGLSLRDWGQAETEARKWISGESSRAKLLSHHRLIEEFNEKFEQSSKTYQEIPELQPHQLTRTNLNDAIASAAMGAVVIRKAFHTRIDLSWSWLANVSSGEIRFTNGYFPQKPETALVERSCHGVVAKDFSTRKSEKRSDGFKEFFSDTAAVTDYHYFGSPIDATCDHDGHGAPPSDRHGGFAKTLNDMVLKSASRHNALDASITQAMGQALRPIATVMRKGSPLSFHTHTATWFALTHGRKAWWLGPAHLADTLASLGNNGSAVSPCEYLKERPHPELKLVVQEPGDIMYFGELVSHATCALEDSAGVGSQFGYFPQSYVMLAEKQKCSSQGGPLATCNKNFGHHTHKD